MKIVTLNTWGGRIKEPLFKFFAHKSEETDIFCLQEVYKSAEDKETHPDYNQDNLNLFDDLCEILKDTHNGYFNPAIDDYYGLATFISKKMPVKERGEIIIFPGVADHYHQHQRNLQYFVVSRGDKDFLICNLHGLWNGQGKTDTEDRINQSKKIKEFLNEREEDVIVCGDFNLEPHTESIKTLEENLVNLIKIHNITSTRSSYYKKPVKHADYILISPNINVKTFEILPNEISDHLPLELSFE